MMLSILIPAIPERLYELKKTIEVYQRCINLYGLQDEVEILSIVDNKKRTIGGKCNSLISIASGDYVVRTDDDDYLTQMYFSKIEAACRMGVDVITYIQDARINEDRTTVVFGLKSENQDFQHNGITKRPAWHCCTWRRELLEGIYFPDINYGEDEPFARLANEKAQTSYHINEVCHVYVHDSTKTASFDERNN